MRGLSGDGAGEVRDTFSVNMQHILIMVKCLHLTQNHEQ